MSNQFGETIFFYMHSWLHVSISFFLMSMFHIIGVIAQHVLHISYYHLYFIPCSITYYISLLVLRMFFRKNRKRSGEDLKYLDNFPNYWYTEVQKFTHIYIRKILIIKSYELKLSIYIYIKKSKLFKILNKKNYDSCLCNNNYRNLTCIHF